MERAVLLSPRIHTLQVPGAAPINDESTTQNPESSTLRDVFRQDMYDCRVVDETPD